MLNPRLTPEQERDWLCYERFVRGTLPLGEAISLLKHARPVFERRCVEVNNMKSRFQIGRTNFTHLVS
jgi:hypothetical protein